jgi:hypothetical protein
MLHEAGPALESLLKGCLVARCHGDAIRHDNHHGLLQSSGQRSAISSQLKELNAAEIRS